jgi:hypothetical protein
MTGMSESKAESVDRERCLTISLQAEASRLRASDGKEIPFTRAVLILRNDCQWDVVGIALHASLGQEGGTVQDVTHALAPSASASLSSGGTLSRDVYDLLLPAHPGTASKVHMFGHRAVLNWTFDLAVWAEYRLPGSSGPVRTPVARWVLRWHVPDPATGAVALVIEEGKD